MARVGQRTGDRIVGVVPGKTEGRQRAPGPGGVAVRFRVHRSPGPECSMDIAYFSPALVSAGTVALAEIGDKTQLLALVLAARFRKPLPIVVGILVATLLNHALAGWLGTLVAHWLTPQVLRWVVAGSFLAIALWSLKPDTLDEDTPVSAHGALMATVVAFFLAEIGDKTQVATVLLAANYSPLWQVVAGTTIGMLLANVPVVILGARFAHRLPLRAARTAAALLFLTLAAWVAWHGVR
jgi:putative Ca2+/H+ antiporter (TMEM165/GDT1 family)